RLNLHRTIPLEASTPEKPKLSAGPDVRSRSIGSACVIQRVKRDRRRARFETRGAHSEGTSCFAHSAARSLIRSYLSVAGLPCRTMVAFLRSSRGKVIALATAERNLMEP